MKKVEKFFMAALLAGMCSFGYAQTKYEWEKPIETTETEVGVVSITLDGGYCENGGRYGSLDRNELISYSKENMYEKLLSKAKTEYGVIYPTFKLRNFKYECKSSSYSKGQWGTESHVAGRRDNWYVFASVVVINPSVAANDKLSQVVDKALQNVREGSRLAIDQVSVRNGTNREDFKDQLIDMLLDKGYKVVAKEYLAQLYEEQQAQQSGIYNDRTTVQENNFSAVGYYINVKVTETSLRVQVVNVSTGEYEGNATVNF